jgi:hypothetical protein
VVAIDACSIARLVESTRRFGSRDAPGSTNFPFKKRAGQVRCHGHELNVKLRRLE